MADRSYLFAADDVPPTIPADGRRPVGISEFSYDIPIVFKVLLSGQPRTCRSIIWESPDEIAIVGDFAQGVAALQKFLDRIQRPEVEPLRQEALEFLTAEANRRRYFILECGEVFDMDEDPMTERNASLLHEIKNLDASIDSAIASLSNSLRQNEPAKQNTVLGWLLGSKPPVPKDPMDPFYHLGLGCWENVLYYTPAGTEE